MKTFEELKLLPPIERALAGENYVTPTPIQAQTVPPALAGKDILGCAQTGTGKTAAFALPILQRLARQNRKALPNRPFALVLAPTRELAVQIGASFDTYGKHLKLRQTLIYGGISQRRQVRQLERGSHILVATPGRLLDLMNQGHISLEELEVFVLDEADRMLDMGFLPDLKRIIKQLPDRRQSLFFSATLPPNIISLSQRLLHKPVSVNVAPKSQEVKKIQQQVLFIQRGEKQAMLRQILDASDCDRALVFTKTKRGANTLAVKLAKTGIKVTAIHGNKTQSARQRALDDFRTNRVRVLVATDVAARGIDIDGITHVVNFDLPIEPENYVHRIGRTGRAGAEGTAVSFCSEEQRGALRAIEKLLGHKVPLGEGQDDPQSSQRPGRKESSHASNKRRRRKPSRPAKRGATAKGKAQKTTGTAPAKAEHPKRKRRPRKGKNARQRAKQIG